METRGRGPRNPLWAGGRKRAMTGWGIILGVGVGVGFLSMTFKFFVA